MIPGLDLIPHFRKARRKQMPERPHLFMAGLNQKVFLNQWGKPEAQVTLEQLGKSSQLGTMFFTTSAAEEARFSVWIYKKKNRVLLFANEKLVSHFSCNKFRFSPLPDISISSETPPIGRE